MLGRKKKKAKLTEMFFVLKDFMTFTGVFPPMFVYPTKASDKGAHSRLQTHTTVYQSEAGLVRAGVTAKLHSRGVHLLNSCFQIHNHDLSNFTVLNMILKWHNTPLKQAHIHSDYFSNS